MPVGKYPIYLSLSLKLLGNYSQIVSIHRRQKGRGGELSLALAFAGYGLFSNGNVDECDKTIKTLRRGHRQGRRAVVGLQGN